MRGLISVRVRWQIYETLSAQVSEKPVEDDDHEEGVVCGSITLGGDWPHNVRKIRALAGKVEDMSQLT